MIDDWLRVSVWPGSRRDEVIRTLFAAGCTGLQELGEGIVTYMPASTDNDALRGALAEASADARIGIEPAPTVDWNERWKDSIHAHRLGAITVAPPWLSSGLDPARAVVIDPGMAFGTGEHATTRGVIRLMPAVIRFGDRVADLGAGSAVLAIAAAKLGAAHVAAIELDTDAIANAEENVARNQVAERVAVLEGDAELLLPLVAPVRVVLANIISSVLVQLLPTIAAAVGYDGEAILSGILWEERQDMLSVLGAMGWRVVAEDHEDIWWSATVARR